MIFYDVKNIELIELLKYPVNHQYFKFKKKWFSKDIKAGFYHVEDYFWSENTIFTNLHPIENFIDKFSEIYNINDVSNDSEVIYQITGKPYVSIKLISGECFDKIFDTIDEAEEYAIDLSHEANLKIL